MKIIGLSLLVGLIGGMFIIGASVEVVALIAIPFCLVIAGYFIGALIPVVAIACGLIIGMFFLRLIRR